MSHIQENLNQDIPVEPYNPRELVRIAETSTKDAIETYIYKYFYRTYKGIYFYQASEKKFEYIDKRELEDYIPSHPSLMYCNGTKMVAVRRMVIDAIDRYRIEMSPTAPLVDKEKQILNMMAKPMHCDKKPIDNPETHKGYKLMLNHIFEVLCSGDEAQYQYVLRWLACTVSGRKLKTTLLLHSHSEQTGKSFLITFLCDYVLGKQLVLTTSHLETVSLYTMPMAGRMLVNINELPCATTGQFKMVKEQLKTLITEETFQARAMHQQSFTCNNTFNFILNTNNDALHLTSNFQAKLVLLDVSNKYAVAPEGSDEQKERTDYFHGKNGLDQCLNMECGQAFYEYMRELYDRENLANWNAQTIPKSKSRANNIAMNRPKVATFIIKQFIKKNNSLIMPLAAFHVMYNQYHKDQISISRLHSNLQKHLNMKATKVTWCSSCSCIRKGSKGCDKECDSARHLVLNYTCKELRGIFEFKGYIHETDEIDSPEDFSYTGYDVIDEEPAIDPPAAKPAKVEPAVEPAKKVRLTPDDSDFDSQSDYPETEDESAEQSAIGCVLDANIIA